MKFPKPMMILLMILIALLLYFGDGQAQNDNSWFISKNGSDANNGWTYETAVLTFNGSSILDSLSSGDTLYIDSGKWNEMMPTTLQYWNDDSSVLSIDDMHGTAANPIVIRNYPGTFPRFRGDADSNAYDPNYDMFGDWTVPGAIIWQSSHIELDSLRFTHCFNHGIMLEDADSITIKYCQLDSNYIRDQGENGGGFTCYGFNGYWESYHPILYGNWIFDNGRALYVRYDDPDPRWEYVGLYGTTNVCGIINLGSIDGIYRQNIISGSPSGGGLRLKGWNCDRNWIDSNVIHSNYSGYEINPATSSDSNVFCFNVLYNNKYAIYWHGGHIPGGYVNNRVYNNTIYSYADDYRGVSIGLGVGWTTFDDPNDAIQTAMVFFNNIVYNTPYNGGAEPASPMVFRDSGQTFEYWDYNCWYGASSGQTGVFYWKEQNGNPDTLSLSEHISAHSIDVNSIWDDPEFLSLEPAADSFLHIRNSSPISDQGRGGSWPGYMGAFAPTVTPPIALDSVVADSFRCDYSDEYDSIRVITYTNASANGDSIFVMVSTTGYGTKSSTKDAGDTIASQGVIDTFFVSKQIAESSPVYITGFTWDAVEGYSSAVYDSIYLTGEAQEAKILMMIKK